MLANFGGEGSLNQPLNMPETHVEWNDCHTDVLCCLLVNIRQLQPGMVLLLPGLQGLLSGVGRVLAFLVGQKFIKQLVLQGVSL